MQLSAWQLVGCTKLHCSWLCHCLTVAQQQQLMLLCLQSLAAAYDRQQSYDLLLSRCQEVAAGVSAADFVLQLLCGCGMYVSTL